jgi:hypothetical protein
LPASGQYNQGQHMLCSNETGVPERVIAWAYSED